MSEIRDRVKEKAQHLWCQHCKALQKSNDTVVDCWYNPLDNGHEKAFCAANEDAVREILSNPEIAIVDREAELPENPYLPRFYDQGRGYEQGQSELLEAGWVKEVKDADKDK